MTDSDAISARLRPQDTILLKGLRVRAHHGVYDFERENGQDFVVDVQAHLDLSTAAASGDLGHTVHYGELATEIADAVRRDPVHLIETVAERVADVVLAHEQVHSVWVTVHKPDAPIDIPYGDVAVRILRGRS
jgi:dihydroneopterin aldolase/dihydroneopterin aldolase/2-amino-4-hydroxy-6-hydroxymethyldihydropteridine diphosphokinase